MTDNDLMQENFGSCVPLATALRDQMDAFERASGAVLDSMWTLLNGVREDALTVIKERDELKARLEGLEK